MEQQVSAQKTKKCSGCGAQIDKAQVFCSVDIDLGSAEITLTAEG